MGAAAAGERYGVVGGFDTRLWRYSTGAGVGYSLAMNRVWARIVATVIGAGLMLVAAPTAAAADEAACLDTYLNQGSRELVQLDQSIILPPLRGSGYDCASHIADRSLVFVEGSSVDYALLYVDFSFSEFLDLLARFQNTGWLAGGETVSVDLESAAANVPLTIAEARALTELPVWGTIRFSNLQTGRNIVAMTWANGPDAQNDAAITTPSLLVEVTVTERLDGVGIADPSTLSTLRTIFQAAPDPTQWAVIGGGSVVLMLLVGWPSTLLNSVVGSRYQAMTMWVRGRFRRSKEEPAQGEGNEHPARPRGSGLPGWLMWPGFALAALIGAFVDPNVGINWMSLRLVITLFLSFVLFNLAAWQVVRAVARRIQPDSQPYLRFRWASLAIVAIAVIVARLLELQPGVIFGLVAGIAYAVTLQASRSAMITLVGSAFGLVLAMVGWLGYSLLAPVSAGSENVVLVFLVEFLAGVTIKGVATLPLSLLPIGTLDGVKIVKWKRWAWGVAYAVGLAAFMLVLLTIPKAWGDVPGDFLKWSLLFVGYAALAVLVWAVNAWRLSKRKPKPEAEQGDQPDAITID